MKKALIVIDLQNDYFCNGNMELVNIDEALRINCLWGNDSYVYRYNSSSWT